MGKRNKHIISIVDAENLKNHVEVVELAGSHGPLENKTLQANVHFDNSWTLYEIISSSGTHITYNLDNAIRIYNNS